MELEFRLRVTCLEKQDQHDSFRAKMKGRDVVGEVSFVLPANTPPETLSKLVPGTQVLLTLSTADISDSPLAPPTT